MLYTITIIPERKILQIKSFLSGYPVVHKLKFTDSTQAIFQIARWKIK